MSIIFHITKIEEIEDDLILVYANIMDTDRDFIFKLTRKKDKLFNEEIIKYKEYTEKLGNLAILNKYYFKNNINTINIVNILEDIKDDVVLFDPLELIYSAYTKNKYYTISMDNPKKDNYVQLSTFISSKICKNNFDKQYLKLFSRVIVNLAKIAKNVNNCNFHPDNFYINSKGGIKIANFENFIGLYNSSNCDKWLKVQEKCKTLKKNQILFTFLIKLIRKFYKNKNDTVYLYEYIQIYIEQSKKDIDIDEIFDSDNVYDRIINAFSSLNKVSNIISSNNVQDMVSNLKKSDLDKMISILGSDNKMKLLKVLNYVKSSNSVLSKFINNIEKNLTK